MVTCSRAGVGGGGLFIVPLIQLLLQENKSVQLSLPNILLVSVKLLLFFLLTVNAVGRRCFISYLLRKADSICELRALLALWFRLNEAFRCQALLISVRSEGALQTLEAVCFQPGLWHCWCWSEAAMRRRRQWAVWALGVVQLWRASLQRSVIFLLLDLTITML